MWYSRIEFSSGWAPRQGYRALSSALPQSFRVQKYYPERHLLQTSLGDAKQPVQVIG
ncbi:MAG TPA: hypothetical protein VN023_04075 [Methylovorus sp.]|jgi:hypothetical protein|nr:hypothetical protein [Methylovorus sp.]